MEFNLGEDEVLDPRISIELDNLNTGTDEINKLEKELDKANTSFRTLLTHRTAELEQMLVGRKIGTSVERARPFYNALKRAQEAHRLCLRAAGQFQRANEIHAEAKALVKQAEMRNPKALDSAWQEVLNHATIKVMEAEELKKSSELTHRLRTDDFKRAESQVHELEKSLRAHIEKSRPFFLLKDQLNGELEGVKAEIEALQKSIGGAKKYYADSLMRLERISEEIHERRSTSKSSSTASSFSSS